MPLLLLNFQQSKRGAKLPARTLIGRRSMNHFVIDDPAVSRMHCWIDHIGDRHLITDMRSRTGTRVNGSTIRKYQALADGDVIEVGPARLTFLTSDRVPLDHESFDLPREPAVLARDLGIRFDCPHCQAPMWAATQYARHGGVCTYCGEGFTIPPTSAAPFSPKGTPASPGTNRKGRVFGDFDSRLDALQAHSEPLAPGESDFPIMPVEAAPASDSQPGELAANGLSERARSLVSAYVIETPEEAERAVAEANTRAQAARSAARRIRAPAEVRQPAPMAPAANPLLRCGVCQSVILPTEAQTTCPSCGLHFHEECWQENYGCSAYGCVQVNALKPPETESAVQDAASPQTATMDVAVPRTQWEFVLLGLSAVGALASAVSFGAVSLVTLAASMIYLRRSRQIPDRKFGVLLGAIALSVLGMFAGAGVSYVLFIYGRARH